MFIAGIREIKELEEGVDVKWKPRDWTTNGLLYLMFLILGGGLLWAIQRGIRPPIPIGWWSWGAYVFISLGAIAAAPWVLLVWRAHAQLHQINTKPDSSIKSDASIDDLTLIWSQIVNILLALTLLVTSATLVTGALRIAVTAKAKPVPGGKFEPFVKLEDYPSSHVLLFGAFFTLLLAVAVLPLVAAWRGKARSLVDHLAPFKYESASSNPSAGTPGKDADAAKGKDADAAEAADDKRSKLEKHLHLDAGLLQSPLTGLSILTPLLASVLAVFIPELATK